MVKPMENPNWPPDLTLEGQDARRGGKVRCRPMGTFHEEIQNPDRTRAKQNHGVPVPPNRAKSPKLSGDSGVNRSIESANDDWQLMDRLKPVKPTVPSFVFHRERNHPLRMHLLATPPIDDPDWRAGKPAGRFSGLKKRHHATGLLTVMGVLNLCIFLDTGSEFSFHFTPYTLISQGRPRSGGIAKIQSCVSYVLQETYSPNASGRNVSIAGISCSMLITRANIPSSLSHLLAVAVQSSYTCHTLEPLV
ncbi:hypothetical protein V8F06_003749 [Rhypophila decipiens]